MADLVAGRPRIERAADTADAVEPLRARLSADLRTAMKAR
jgi:hypothetical protein